MIIIRLKGFKNDPSAINSAGKMNIMANSKQVVFLLIMA
jgi:hypothetical protein